MILLCCREKLESRARSGHKGVSALIWTKKKRKEKDRRRGIGGGVMFYVYFQMLKGVVSSFHFSCIVLCLACASS